MDLKTINIFIFAVTLLLSSFLSQSLVNSGYICRRSREVLYPERFLRFVDSIGRDSKEMADRFEKQWQEHIDLSREFIINGTEGINRERVVIIGAGNCTDIPLEELAYSFQSVILQDIDFKAIEAVRSGLSPDLKSKVSLRAEDISSIGALFLSRAIEIIDSSIFAKDAVRGIIDYMSDIELTQWNISEEDQADYIVCSLVLSVLMWTEFAYLEKLLEGRFDELKVAAILDSEWEKAKSDFRYRVIDNILNRLAATLRPGGRLILADSVIKIC